MAAKDLTTAQALALYGVGATRLAGSGLLVPSPGLQPYYAWLVSAMNHLDAASAGWLRVLADDASDTTVRILAGRAAIGGEVLSYAGGTLDLVALDDDVAYVYLKNNSGAAQIAAVADASGWPAEAHIPLAMVTLADGAITAIVDVRSESILTPPGESGRYELAILTQGDTGTPSVITITRVDRRGQTIAAAHLVRVRVCDASGYADATNATIAAGTNTTAVETISAGKDLVVRSHTDGVARINLTDATAETVLLRIGPAPLGATAGDYTPTLDVEHAAP